MCPQVRQWTATRLERNRTRQLWPGTRATMHSWQYRRSLSMGVLVRMPMARARDTYLRLRSRWSTLASTTARSISLVILDLAMCRASRLETRFLAMCCPLLPNERRGWP